MNVYDACECAYKNRYEKGYEQGKREANEKQIPQKTIKTYNGETTFHRYSYYCPNCNKRIYDIESDFCKHCGQALDWDTDIL